MYGSDFLVGISCKTYNQSAYITDALNGFAMQQTNFPYVAVVIDDASTDGEQAVIKGYLEEHFDHSEEKGYKQWETEDAHWTFARHKENGNCHFVLVYLKRNLFKEREKKDSVVKDWMDSRYIALCEGDDYWTDPLKLQKQVDYMEEHKDCCMTACAADRVKEEKIFKNDRISDEPRDLTTDEVILGGGGYLATCSLVYDNSKLNDNIPKWRRNANVGDYPLQIQGTLEGKLHYLPDTMCVYRYGHNGSWSSINEGENKELTCKHWRKEIDWMIELDEATQHEYKHAIFQHLKSYYPQLYIRHMVSIKDYLRIVLVAGNRYDYKRLVKDFVKRMLN